MQRITRYGLLLRQLLHYTSKHHVEHDATLIALQLSSEYLEKLNANTRIQESLIRIETLSKQIDPIFPAEVQSSSYF
jgi:hypothetical protein